MQPASSSGKQRGFDKMSEHKGITNMQVIFIIAIIIGAGIYFGYININQHPGQVTGTSGTSFPSSPTIGQQFYRTDLSKNYQWTGTTWQEIGGTPPPTGGGVTHGAAAIQFSICDKVKGDSVSGTAQDTGVDIISANTGVFDLLSFGENKTDTAYPDQSSSMYPQGSQLLIHAYSSEDPSNGLDYYDQWYYVVLVDANPIYCVTINNFVVSAGSPHYTYTISTAGATTTGFTVAFTSGTTNYWDIGKLYIWPRTSEAGLNLYLTYAGSTGCSSTGGSYSSRSSSTANFTLTGRNEHLDLLLTQDNANLAYGVDQIIVTSFGQVTNYKTCIIMTTNMTSLDASQFAAEGWTPINDNTLYGEKAYFKTIGPFYTTKGALWTADNLIPVYCGASGNSERGVIKLYVIDIQLTPNIAIGACQNTTIPTAYGMVSAYGPGAFNEIYGYQVSSGAASGPMLTDWIITPSS